MATGVNEVRQSRRSANGLSRWQSIDWAMRAISLAAHVCQAAGLDDVALELVKLHESARIHRDESI